MAVQAREGLLQQQQVRVGAAAVAKFSEGVLRAVLEGHVEGFRASPHHATWLTQKWISAQPVSGLDFGLCEVLPPPQRVRTVD